MKIIRCVLAMLFSMVVMDTMALGQVIDSFSDGDFTSAPTWGGDTGSWQIVTSSTSGPNAAGSETLRLNHGISEYGTQYLSTQRIGSWGTGQSWGFWLGRRASSTATDSNHSIVWLWASESNLESNTVDGYRIRFGDSSGGDEIYLQRMDDGAPTDILTSSGAVTAGLADIAFLVRATRTSGSVWTLYTSVLPTANGGGAAATETPSVTNTSVLQGSVADSTYTDFTDGYFGFMAVHSSSSTARTGAEFDQLYFDTNSDASLPVELSTFNATPVDGSILLSWRTESEVENLGFNIYRSESKAGPFDRINGLLIEGAGNSATYHEYEYTDGHVKPGQRYFYYIEDIDIRGRSDVSKVIEILLPTVFRAGVPDRSALLQNFPNPFNPETWIPYQLAKSAAVRVRIYDATGRLIRMLFAGTKEVGYYLTNRDAIYWDGRDDFGSVVASGIYLYEILAGDFSAVKRMAILK